MTGKVIRWIHSMCKMLIPVRSNTLYSSASSDVYKRRFILKAFPATPEDSLDVLNMDAVVSSFGSAAFALLVALLLSSSLHHMGYAFVFSLAECCVGACSGWVKTMALSSTHISKPMSLLPSA